MNFRGHLIVGIIAFFVLFQFVEVPASLYLPAFAITVFFALIADIDIDISHINDFVEISLLLFAVYCFYLSGNDGGSRFFLFGVVAIGIVLFTKFLKHRGWMHSVKAGALLSAPLYFIEPVLALYAFVGFLSHLVADRKLF